MLHNQFGDFNVEQDDNGVWGVYLPHSCDEWYVAGGYTLSPSKEEVISNLKEFLAEGMQALEFLENQED